MRFEADDSSLLISVSNRHSQDVSPNPGMGVGLANTRDRLQLLHPAASLGAGPQGDRFIAEIRLPIE